MALLKTEWSRLKTVQGVMGLEHLLKGLTNPLETIHKCKGVAMYYMSLYYNRRFKCWLLHKHWHENNLTIDRKMRKKPAWAKKSCWMVAKVPNDWITLVFKDKQPSEKQLFGLVITVQGSTKISPWQLCGKKYIAKSMR